MKGLTYTIMVKTEIKKTYSDITKFSTQSSASAKFSDREVRISTNEVMFGKTVIFSFGDYLRC